MAAKTPIDWAKIAVVIDPPDVANPGNPYAEVDQPQRDQAFRELARRVLLRRVNDPSALN